MCSLPPHERAFLSLSLPLLPVPLRWTRVADLRPFTVEVNVRARIVRSEPAREVATKDGRLVLRQRVEVEDPEGGPRAALVLWAEDAGRFRLGNVVELRGCSVRVFAGRVELSVGGGTARRAARPGPAR
jgi:ssDNA-binding replication factor A large subunit